MLEADRLAAIRSDRLVFRDLSFTLPEGGALLLHGPNGAGKSTLLRLLAGLGRIAAGRLLWRGEDALIDRVLHARRVAYLGHQDALKAALTVEETVRSDAAIRGGPARPFRHALGALGLEPLADLPVRILSAGQRRRVALARVAAAGPALWLLDEPTLGLDTASVERLGALIARHRAEGGSIVVATHLPLPVPDSATLRLGG